MIRLFLFLLLFIITNLISYKYFQANLLISGNILLITDAAIFRQDRMTNQIHIIYTIINTENEEQFLNVISFGQFSQNDMGYIICRHKEKIYILYEEIRQINTIENEKLGSYYCKIIPYKLKDNFIIFIIAYINSENKFNLIIYYMNLIQSSYIIIKEKEINNTYVKDAISCDFMNSNKINNEILVCFLSELNTNNLVSIAFDPENDYKEEILSKVQKSSPIEIIKSTVSPDKKISLVCYISSDLNYNCTLFNSEKNIWYSENNLLRQCQKNNYETDVKYINDTSEYIIYIYSENKQLEFCILDENFQIKNKNEQGKTCYRKQELDNCDKKIASSIFYFKKNKGYTIMAKCEYNNLDNDYTLKIEEDCNSGIDIEDFEEQIPISILKTSYIQTTKPNSITTIPSILSSTAFSGNITFSSVLYNLPVSSSINSFAFLNYIYIYSKGDIIRGKINITKNEVENNMKELMDFIIINQKYKFYGEDYNITISPINDINSINSVFIDYTECIDILREKYSLSSEEILTVLQIDINKMNEKSLINQIEYAIYNEKKEKLNLEYCKNTEFKVHYDIKNYTLLNKSMITYFSNLGIDILDIQDPFFNDICFPYSNSESDIVLKDRIADIYQNYSFCDNNCEYDGINLENMSISCSCKIKKILT